MTTAVQPPPRYFGRTIFAEDIRAEASGQFSIIGVFPGGIHLPSFPTMIGKIGMMVEFQRRADLQPADVRFAAFLPGASADDPCWEHRLSVEEQQVSPPNERLQADALSGPYPAELVARMVQITIMTGVNVAEPGMLQVRAFVGDEIFAIGGLHIVPLPEPA